MTQYGMGDEATIDEVIDDVDTDKVSLIFCWIPTIFYELFSVFHWSSKMNHNWVFII